MPGLDVALMVEQVGDLLGVVGVHLATVGADKEAPHTRQDRLLSPPPRPVWQAGNYLRRQLNVKLHRIFWVSGFPTLEIKAKLLLLKSFLVCYWIQGNHFGFMQILFDN
jgi:hypothetical protein